MEASLSCGAASVTAISTYWFHYTLLYQHFGKIFNIRNIYQLNCSQTHQTSLSIRSPWKEKLMSCREMAINIWKCSRFIFLFILNNTKYHTLKPFFTVGFSLCFSNVHFKRLKLKLNVYLCDDFLYFLSWNFWPEKIVIHIE